MKNKIALTLISFLANFIMAGFASQFGMLIEPIAVRYSADVNTVASIFSLLNGGALAGTIAAFFLIEKIGVKRMTLIIYSIVFLCALAMHLSPGLWPVMVAMTGGFLRRHWSVRGGNDRGFGLAGSHSKYDAGGAGRHL